MNAQTQAELDHFVTRLDAFLVRCSEFEKSGKWNTNRLGFMSAYFETDLFAVALQIMSADGRFERAEAEVFNAMFQTSYTPKQLWETYHSVDSVVDGYIDTNVSSALTRLKRVDRDLAEEYRQLILGVCQVVSLADGVAEGEEVKIIDSLRAALEA